MEDLVQQFDSKTSQALIMLGPGLQVFALLPAICFDGCVRRLNMLVSANSTRCNQICDTTCTSYYVVEGIASDVFLGSIVEIGDWLQ
jgi:hypothetical protein